jgi:hypothetical protein
MALDFGTALAPGGVPVVLGGAVAIMAGFIEPSVLASPLI